MHIYFYEGDIQMLVPIYSIEGAINSHLPIKYHSGLISLAQMIEVV